MVNLDTLVRNEHRLTLYHRREDQRQPGQAPYKVVFYTPEGFSSYECKNYGEAKDRFKALAIEQDMVSLD